MNAVAVGGAVWTLAVVVGVLAVAWLVHGNDRWARATRQRKWSR